MKHEIKDLTGKTILEEQRKRILQSSDTFLERVNLPLNIMEGRYLLITKIFTGESFVATSYLFDVEKELKPPFEISSITLIFAAIVFVMLFALIFVVLYVQRNLNFIVKRHQKSLGQISLEYSGGGKPAKALRKLRELSDFLDRAYKLGTVNKLTYLKEHRKLKAMIRKIRAKR